MISIIIPFYNEVESLPILIDRLVLECKKIGKEYEIILVDDGSCDAGVSKLKIKSEKFKVLKHKKRLGKGEALSTGIKNSSGDILVFMDADLQNDPADLPSLLAKINGGYDFVNGVRIGRHENSPILSLYSSLAEKFLRIFARSPYKDINCGFKAFKRSVIKDFPFYSNNFRFFPLYVYYNGFKVTETEVKDNPRQFGKSKFGAGKLMAGILDTLTAFFLYKFAERPLYFFGGVGAVLFLTGFLVSFVLTIERLFFGVMLSTRPLLWLGILLIIIGIQIIMTGIIGELIVYLNQISKIKDQRRN